jgi:polar amino acid transport system substrate-binding protein
MSKYVVFASLMIVATSFLFSCASIQETAKPENEPIRVGMTPNYPPIIFKTDRKLSGAEVDMARLLGEALRRPVRFIELEWDEQIPALLAGKIDIIMSGMSITDARKVRINFAEPYMKAGLATAMRAEDASYYDSQKKIKEAPVTIGAMVNTTGDVFVQRNFPDAIRISFRTMGDAVYSLKNRRVDLFIHDAPAIAWVVSENEAELKGFWQLWNVEYLAWGLRREDQDFLASVNSILSKWKNDGTLERVLNQWVPYMKKMIQLFGFLDSKKFFEVDKSAAFIRGKSEGEVKK